MYYEVLAVITMSITFYFIYYQSSPSYSPFHVVMVTMSVDYFLHFSSLVAYSLWDTSPSSRDMFFFILRSTFCTCRQWFNL